MISSIYTSTPVVHPRVRRRPFVTGRAPRTRSTSYGFKLRAYEVGGEWVAAEHGYIPARDEQDAIHQARLYLTWDVAVRAVGARESWFVRFL